MKTHRELYPDQYEHELVGKTVQFRDPDRGHVYTKGTVERVVNSRFGKLARLKGGVDAYKVSHAEVVDQESEAEDFEVLYLSDGEQSALLSFNEICANLREVDAAIPGAAPREMGGHSSIEEMLSDMAGALDNQGFWHGTIGVYNVAIVRADKARKLLQKRA